MRDFFIEISFFKLMEIKRIPYCDQPHSHWWEYIYNSYSQNSPHNSKHFIDVYTLTHIFWSMLMVFIGKKINSKYLLGAGNYTTTAIVAIIVTVFEIHENLPEQIKKYHRIEVDSLGESTYRGDSTLNIVGDILFNFLGVYLGYTMSDSNAVCILAGLYIVITSVVGMSYWTDFFKFLFTSFRLS